jgi:CBS domain-containing protein
MSRELITVSPSDPILRVAALICQKRISGIPVLDEDGQLTGIVSEKDVLKAMYPSYDEFFEDPLTNMDFERMEERFEDVKKRPVKNIMTPHVITLSPDTPILKAASTMILRRIRRIPVVAGGKLVGIVSQGDIHQALFKRVAGSS